MSLLATRFPDGYRGDLPCASESGKQSSPRRDLKKPIPNPRCGASGTETAQFFRSLPQFRPFRDQEWGIWDAVFSLNGAFIVTISYERDEGNRLVVWDAEHGTQVHKKVYGFGRANRANRWSALGVSPDGASVITSLLTRQFDWDFHAGAPMQFLNYGFSEDTSTISASANGHYIVFGHFDGSASLWKRPTKDESAPPRVVGPRHSRRIRRSGRGHPPICSRLGNLTGILDHWPK